MSLATETLTGSSRAGVSMGTAGDFFALLKPRVMSLVVFTALVGMALAPHVNPVIGFAALLAIAVGALVILFFVVTIAKLGGNVVNRPL